MFDATGEDPLAVDNSLRTRFTYANGSKGWSLGRVGIPHPLGLLNTEGKIWFTMVDTPSPTLLGLDYLEAANAHLEQGRLVYEDDGHEEPLERLATGHWGLPLI